MGEMEKDKSRRKGQRGEAIDQGRVRCLCMLEQQVEDITSTTGRWICKATSFQSSITRTHKLIKHLPVRTAAQLSMAQQEWRTEEERR